MRILDLRLPWLTGAGEVLNRKYLLLRLAPIIAIGHTMLSNSHVTISVLVLMNLSCRPTFRLVTAREGRAEQSQLGLVQPERHLPHGWMHLRDC